MPAVNLRHIEIFHAVMTAGNLTEAAQMLHTSQPTVSRELARFEKVLGLKLFERTRGGCTQRYKGCVCSRKCSARGMGWTELSVRRKACASFVRANCRLSACPSFHNPFTDAAAAFSGPLSGGQSHYRAAGISAAGRVAFSAASRPG